MVTRYPHSIQLQTAGTTITDSHGNLSIVEAEKITVSARVKLANQHNVREGEFSVGFNYKITASMPIQEHNYTNGFLTFEHQTYRIVRFHTYQNRSKVWAD